VLLCFVEYSVSGDCLVLCDFIFFDVVSSATHHVRFGLASCYCVLFSPVSLGVCLVLCGCILFNVVSSVAHPVKYNKHGEFSLVFVLFCFVWVLFSVVSLYFV